MAHQPQPDWADLLAKEWIDQLREIYRNRGYDGTPSKPLVIKTGKELVKPIDRVFGQTIDYSGPDYAMREALKRNVWKFSVAKNDNDNKRLSNLLLKEDGNLRPWNEFKREALKVVGTSNRYLKTEYDTIVAGAQMSRLWQEIQRDKHIFPFVQFDVVWDKRTSDICKPLHKVIMKVEDPRLAYYFPPNHFNCRTTVRKLRNGVPTENVELPEIPEAFMNNVGMCPNGYEELSLSAGGKKPPKRESCGEIFTKGNSYFEKTAEELLKYTSYTKVDDVWVGYPHIKKTSSPHEQKRVQIEADDRIAVAKALQKEFNTYTVVLPEIRYDHWAYEMHFEGVKLNKSPDFKIGANFWEMESYEGKFKLHKLSQMLKDGVLQADMVAIKLRDHVPKEKLLKQIERLEKGKFNSFPNMLVILDKYNNIIINLKK